jgi:predicted dehydrogenase
MAVRDIGIILNGATGRIGSTQHLANALAPIRAEGGLAVGPDRIVPRLLLVGRDAERLVAIAQSHGAGDWTTDLDAALARPGFSVFFDAAATKQRMSSLNKAIAAGKHIYSEKPVAPSVADGLALLRAAQARGLKAGVVEDKLNLPGLQKLLGLAQKEFFGRVTGFRLDFGWWVFDGAEQPSQRPSWNYRRSGGGGLTSDMVPHWRYVIEGILGPIRRVVTAAATAIPERVDENGRRYQVDVDDTSLTLAELASGAVGAIVCSWATRVHRRFGIRRPAPLLDAKQGRNTHHPALQSRRRYRRRLSRAMERSRQHGGLHKSLPGRLGEFSAPRRCRDAANLRSFRRRPRRTAGGGLLPQRRRTEMDHAR